ncbi:hypothetical protein [Thalassotalea ganghwensis]
MTNFLETFFKFIFGFIFGLFGAAFDESKEEANECNAELEVKDYGDGNISMDWVHKDKYGEKIE